MPPVSEGFAIWTDFLTEAERDDFTMLTERLRSLGLFRKGLIPKHPHTGGIRIDEIGEHLFPEVYQLIAPIADRAVFLAGSLMRQNEMVPVAAQIYHRPPWDGLDWHMDDDGCDNMHATAIIALNTVREGGEVEIMPLGGGENVLCPQLAGRMVLVHWKTLHRVRPPQSDRYVMQINYRSIVSRGTIGGIC
ncbi:2OG-Fe(II) oxygenase [Candidatus Poriferisocius sp.]|uniref:2OG-Fe(II) oxygenase n=1 Tax=Candidatus Poriferisocius sp. TaxID=3101276 RepID=UPI003B01CF2E